MTYSIETQWCEIIHPFDNMFFFIEHPPRTRIGRQAPADNSRGKTSGANRPIKQRQRAGSTSLPERRERAWGWVRKKTVVFFESQSKMKVFVLG